LHAAGEIVWKTTELLIPVTEEERLVEFSFEFINKKTSSIEITHMETSCNCVVASLKNKSFKPGEIGNITGVYTIKTFPLLQNVSIIVSYDEITGDGRKSFKQELNLKVKVNEIINMNPGVILWRKSDLGIKRESIVSINNGRRYKISLSNDISEEFSFKLIDLIPYEKVKIIIDPFTRKECSTRISVLFFDLETGETIKKPLYLMIR
jgi:hypothetical protein